jgi:hypothetical protein
MAVDAQSNTVAFSLDMAPEDAAINATNGVLTWQTTAANANTTNLITVRATDGGVPPLSDTRSFTATVISRPTLTDISISNGVATLSWTAIPNQGYRLQFKDELNLTNWTTASPEIIAVGVTASATNAASSQGQRFYRILVTP